ncbi:MAG: tetratricopeptide repeat protein [Planctomycetota bacterium]|mgnify:CR=1 FL=1
MKPLALAAALLAALFSLPARAEDGAAEDYQKALDKENTDRDLNGAMEIYKSILKKHKDEEEIAAKAQFRLAECWEKLAVPREAKEAYEAVVRDYPGQVALVDKAKEKLAAMAGTPVQKNPEDIVARKLETTKIDLDFTDSTLYDILDFLQEFARVNILVDPAAAELAEKKFTFAVKDLALNKVLALLADSTHLSFVNRKGILLWSTPERIAALQQNPAIQAGEDAAEDDKKVSRSLESIKISLNFTQTPVDETMSFIREVTQLNVIVDDSCKQKTVTLKLDETTLRDALELIAFGSGLDIKISNGALVVKAK